jgi:hypothetical protein
LQIKLVYLNILSGYINFLTSDMGLMVSQFGCEEETENSNLAGTLAEKMLL